MTITNYLILTRITTTLTLDFFEVLKLYYIIRSGWSFYDAFNWFILGILFFSVKCFSGCKTTYDFYHGCFKARMSCQGHRYKTQFLDMYTLLQVTRNIVHHFWGHRPTIKSVLLMYESCLEISNKKTNNFSKPISEHTWIN